jgi:hypothetical protein
MDAPLSFFLDVARSLLLSLVKLAKSSCARRTDQYRRPHSISPMRLVTCPRVPFTGAQFI